MGEMGNQEVERVFGARTHGIALNDYRPADLAER